MKTTLILFAALFSFSCLFNQVTAQQAVKYPVNNPSNIPTVESKKGFSKSIDGISAAMVIQKYITALGGAQQLQNIQSLDFSGSITMAGMQLNFSERKESPNLDYIALSVDTDTIMRSVFDGTSGYNQQISQRTPLTSEEIDERNKDNLGLFNQLFYLDSSNTFTLNKIEKTTENNAQFFLLDITMPSGKQVSEFYDAQSFLLTKTIEKETIDDSTTITTKYFSVYKKINGVQFPSKIDLIKQQNGKEQQFAVTIDATQINLPRE